MSHHPRRILTPSASRKRKETEAFYTVKPPLTPPPARAPPPPLQQPSPSVNVAAAAAAEPDSSSRLLLAGYMAHEYLSKGTLLGQKWDPGREDVAAASSAELRGGKGKPLQQQQERQQSYAEVASLLGMDGAHIPGIVNPTQLARWIQM